MTKILRILVTDHTAYSKDGKCCVVISEDDENREAPETFVGQGLDYAQATSLADLWHKWFPLSHIYEL